MSTVGSINIYQFIFLTMLLEEHFLNFKSRFLSKLSFHHISVNIYRLKEHKLNFFHRLKISSNILILNNLQSLQLQLQRKDWSCIQKIHSELKQPNFYLQNQWRKSLNSWRFLHIQINIFRLMGHNLRISNSLNFLLDIWISNRIQCLLILNWQSSSERHHIFTLQ